MSSTLRAYDGLAPEPFPATKSHPPRGPQRRSFEGLRRWVCQSRAGVWRTEHSPDKDGRCVLCDKIVWP